LAGGTASFFVAGRKHLVAAKTARCFARAGVPAARDPQLGVAVGGAGTACDVLEPQARAADLVPGKLKPAIDNR
jgi:hypothetical protein